MQEEGLAKTYIPNEIHIYHEMKQQQFCQCPAVSEGVLLFKKQKTNLTRAEFVSNVKFS